MINFWFASCFSCSQLVDQRPTASSRWAALRYFPTYLLAMLKREQIWSFDSWKWLPLKIIFRVKGLKYGAICPTVVQWQSQLIWMLLVRGERLHPEAVGAHLWHRRCEENYTQSEYIGHGWVILSAGPGEEFHPWGELTTIQLLVVVSSCVSEVITSWCLWSQPRTCQDNPGGNGEIFQLRPPLKVNADHRLFDDVCVGFNGPCACDGIVFCQKGEGFILDG